MDDYAIFLSLEAKSDTAVLHQFRILHDPNVEAFHFFFEGGDDLLFYMPEARRLLGNRRAHTYDCGGKNNVVAVRQSIILGEYPIEPCLFFVDRDYDDYLNCQTEANDSTYMTDNYSIENDIVSINSAEILLQDVVRMSRTDPDFNIVIEDLKKAFAIFYVLIKPLISWIIAAREAGSKPNLSNTTGLNNIVVLEGSAQPRMAVSGFAHFKNQVLNDRSPPHVSLSIGWRRKLDIDSCKLWVRGKYDLWFFQKAILRLIEESNSRKEAAGVRKIKVPASLRDGRIFEVLGGRIPPPQSLTVFLNNRLQ